MNTRLITILAIVAGIGLATFAPGRADAQCIGPDNMDFIGQCCVQSQPNLPQFPQIKQDIQYISWRNCAVVKRRGLCVDIGVPVPHMLPGGVPAGCGVFDIPWRTRTCGAAQRDVFTGVLIGTYARTWMEDTDGVQGVDTQVWRILINGDLKASQFLLNQFGLNAHIPQCLHDFGDLVYWYGYIDYRLNCQANVWKVEWMLDHECDRYHHNPDSGRPAPAVGYHPDRTYTFVGPSLFVPTIAIPAALGPLVQENTRTLLYVSATAPVICFRDDPIRDGFMEVIQNVCLCAAGAPQYAISNFFGNTVCQSSWGPGPETKVYAQKRMGFYPDAAGNPFKFVILQQGDRTFADACLGLIQPEYFEGVSTIGGFPAFTFQGGPLVPLGRTFIDIGSSNNEVCMKIKAIPHVVCKLICANI